MGLYVEPGGSGKKPVAWMEAHGVLIDEPTEWDFDRPDVLPVCRIVNSDEFQPCAIGFDQQEIDRLRRGYSDRLFYWYSVRTVELMEVAPLLPRYMAEDARAG